MIELLKKNNLKVTKQRLEILNIINELKINASIKNICNRINDLDKSTIYRTLNKLEENNAITKMIGNNCEVIYLIKRNHSHYIKCIKCNKVIELNTCPLEDKLNLNDFKIISHSLVIDGICKDCK